MNGLVFLPLVFIVYFLRKQRLETKIKAYIKEKKGHYVSAERIFFYKNVYIVRYSDGYNNLRKVRVYDNLLNTVFDADEIIE